MQNNNKHNNNTKKRTTKSHFIESEKARKRIPRNFQLDFYLINFTSTDRLKELEKIRRREISLK